MFVAVLLLLQDGLEVSLVNEKPRNVVVRGLEIEVQIAGPADYNGPVTVTGGAKPVTATMEGGAATVKIAPVESTISATAGPHRGSLSVTAIPGWLVILPPLVAIILAIASRQVLVSLLVGVLVGAFLVYAFAPLDAVLRTFDAYLVGQGARADHMMVIFFTLALGGMVGVISRSGGTRGVAEAISRWARTRRSAQVATWGMGLAVFFDDYANCLIVGSTIRPFADKMRIAREKLAYIVDSTAAPVATIALVSTWIGSELSWLNDSGIVRDGNAYDFFISMIPYRLYCIFCLAFVFIVAVSRRDFGPMLAAERRAEIEGKVLADGAEPLTGRELEEIESTSSAKPNWLNAALPVIAVVATVLAGLYFSGKASAPPKAELREIISKADPFAVLVWGSVAGGFVAVVMAMAVARLKLKEVVEAYVAGCKALLLAIFILLLAWSIGQVCKDLDTGPWIASHVTGGSQWLPLGVFLISCVVAFSTGTSFGTMGILIPVAASILLGMDDVKVGDPIILATMVAVLDGATFGDHCSPISDTTILSSMGSGSDHVDHVRTQLPYALTCAGVSALGFVAVGFGVPVWIVLPVGLAALVGIVLGVGKKV